eukprot:2545407-Pleurochrysis_carterae.AAC.1
MAQWLYFWCAPVHVAWAEQPDVYVADFYDAPHIVTSPSEWGGVRGRSGQCFSIAGPAPLGRRRPARGAAARGTTRAPPAATYGHASATRLRPASPRASPLKRCQQRTRARGAAL